MSWRRWLLEDDGLVAMGMRPGYQMAILRGIAAEHGSGSNLKKANGCVQVVSNHCSLSAIIGISFGASARMSSAGIGGSFSSTLITEPRLDKRIGAGSKDCEP